MDKNKKQIVNQGLYLVSTPIGNMEDITLRALNILKSSDFILCEDTRRSGKLLAHFKIKKELISYHKFNEKKITSNVINYLENNKIISLISDAGTPTVSDPGMTLISKCIEKNFNVHPIPGPSAVTAAASASGFVKQYFFYGFLTKKENELEIILQKLSNLDSSIIFFIPASKINFYLSKFKNFFSDRKILIAREMTKLHEEFIREDVKSIKNMPDNLKGELTVILSSKIEENNIKKTINESIKTEIKKMLKKYSHKDVVEYVYKKENLPKKLVYNYCLKIKEIK